MSYQGHSLGECYLSLCRDAVGVFCSPNYWAKYIIKISILTGYNKGEMQLYLEIFFKKVATFVEGDPKAPISIATTPRCRGRRYSIPGLLHFTFDPYLIMLSDKQGGIKYHFLSLWYDSTGIEAWSPGPLANTRLIWPIVQLEISEIYWNQ